MHKVTESGERLTANLRDILHRLAMTEQEARTLRGVFKSLPARTDLPSTINESLVVELYSR